MLSTRKVLTALLCTSALVVGISAQSKIQINGAGATFPNPIYSKWFDEYNKMHPNVEINYQSQGSGAGIRPMKLQCEAWRGRQHDGEILRQWNAGRI